MMKDILGSGMENIIKNCAEGRKIDATKDLEINLDNLVERLCCVNFGQWLLEDGLRDVSLTPETSLLLLRKLQSSNAERASLIDQIDKFLLNKAMKTKINDQPETENEFHETFGQMLDSLSIAYVRKYHMECMIAQGEYIHPYGGYMIEDAIIAIKKQILLIERTYVRIFDMFMRGEITLPPFGRFKLYKSSK